MDSDEQEIRDLVGTWMRATVNGDASQLADLMAENVVFLGGGPPMQGREKFATAFAQALEHVRIEPVSEIQEVRVFGDWAYCWNHLTITLRPLSGGPAERRSGYVLSVLRKEGDGRWRIYRDANMLGPEPPKPR